jgi:hypothetical protein
MRNKHCRECAKPFQTIRPDALFCCIGCKNLFNNRRLQRGAVIYDLFMACRYQRGLAKVMGIWTILCGAALSFHIEDEAVRPGFVSWLDPKEVLERKPTLRNVVMNVGFTGKRRG